MPIPDAVSPDGPKHHAISPTCSNPSASATSCPPSPVRSSGMAGMVALGAVGVRRVGHPGASHAARPLPSRLVYQGDDGHPVRTSRRGEPPPLEQHRSRKSSPTSPPNSTPTIAPVTLEQLLQHRSGLSEGFTFTTTIWPEIWKLEGPLPEQRRQVLKLVFKDAPGAAPGLSYQYSNCGYAIAGAMCEAVTGRTWEDLMRERIFAPLGMTTAGFGPPGTPGQIDQPWGHHLGFWTRRWKAFPPGEKESDNPAAIGPAGNVHCSLADWARFALCHLRGERGESGLIVPSSKEGVQLRADTFRLLHSPTLGGNYAFGWLVEERDWGGGKVLTHAGSNTMWTSLIWLAPQRNLALLAATNLANTAAFTACDAVVGQLIELAERGRKELTGDPHAPATTHRSDRRRGEQPVVSAAARLQERPRRPGIRAARRRRHAGPATPRLRRGPPPRADRRPRRPPLRQRRAPLVRDRRLRRRRRARAEARTPRSSCPGIATRPTAMAVPTTGSSGSAIPTATPSSSPARTVRRTATGDHQSWEPDVAAKKRNTATKAGAARTDPAVVAFLRTSIIP